MAKEKKYGSVRGSMRGFGKSLQKLGLRAHSSSQSVTGSVTWTTGGFDSDASSTKSGRPSRDSKASEASEVSTIRPVSPPAKLEVRSQASLLEDNEVQPHLAKESNAPPVINSISGDNSSVLDEVLENHSIRCTCEGCRKQFFQLRAQGDAAGSNGSDPGMESTANLGAESTGTEPAGAEPTGTEPTSTQNAVDPPSGIAESVQPDSKPTVTSIMDLPDWVNVPAHGSVDSPSTVTEANRTLDKAFELIALIEEKISKYQWLQYHLPPDYFLDLALFKMDLPYAIKKELFDTRPRVTLEHIRTVIKTMEDPSKALGALTHVLFDLISHEQIDLSRNGMSARCLHQQVEYVHANHAKIQEIGIEAFIHHGMIIGAPHAVDSPIFPHFVKENTDKAYTGIGFPMSKGKNIHVSQPPQTLPTSIKTTVPERTQSNPNGADTTFQYDEASADRIAERLANAFIENRKQMRSRLNEAKSPSRVVKPWDENSLAREAELRAKPKSLTPEEVLQAKVNEFTANVEMKVKKRLADSNTDLTTEELVEFGKIGGTETGGLLSGVPYFVQWGNYQNHAPMEDPVDGPLDDLSVGHDQERQKDHNDGFWKFVGPGTFRQ